MSEQQIQVGKDGHIRWEPINDKDVEEKNSKAEKYAGIRSSSFTDSNDRCDVDKYLTRQIAESTTVVVTRSVTIPDRTKIDRCQRLPEYGPRILFFSGGTAIKDLSTVLKDYTYNSIHLITPFDSGGSSAEIRRAFDMLSVGDLRNRLLALSDKNEFTMRNNPYIPLLLEHRLVKDGTDSDVREELESIIKGRHVLMKSVGMPMRSILQSHLRWFYSRMPDDFDLHGASVGNLLICGK
jgi:2-phospho-L-lactate transferase CofD